MPVFVQPGSEQDCLLGSNVLSPLGVTVQRANGEPLRQVGGNVARSQVQLVQAVVVPNHKAKFVEAKLEVPLQKGEELVFEPDVSAMRAFGVVAPESLVILQSDKVLVPVENHEATGPQHYPRVRG